MSEKTIHKVRENIYNNVANQDHHQNIQRTTNQWEHMIQSNQKQIGKR